MGRTRDPARDRPRSCTDCLAWGVMEEIRCRACRSFRNRYRDERECAGCRRTLRVKDGYCRLCRVQMPGGHTRNGNAEAVAAVLPGPGTAISYHQLFFDRVPPQASVTRPPALPAPARDRAPRASRRRGRAWVQTDLLSAAGSRRAPEPASPSLARALRTADRLAESRGWSDNVRWRVRKGLRTALAGCPEGEAVRWSLALPALLAGSLSARHVAEILRHEGLLNDDTPATFDTWLERRLDGLAAGIRRDTGRWLRTLKDGGPRSRPRALSTVQSHLSKALPALTAWSEHHDHLREVTRDDIESVLRPLRGSHRHNALVALRSLFAFCAADGTIFRNPALGIKVGRRPAVTVLQPLGQDDIDDAISAAVTPAARLIIALAGIHAARTSTICSLLLSDADPASRSLTVNGRERPLDDLTAALLQSWLEDRRARWPRTANPHLIINTRTALGTAPVSRIWASTAQRGHAATLEALRADRQLDEALASGADPLHLAATFGIDPVTAVRYASSARQLLLSDAEQQDPGRFPRNPRA